MGEIVGQRLSLSENSMRGLASIIETGAYRINNRLYDMKETDEGLTAEMTGGTLTDFRSTEEFVAAHISLTLRQLSGVVQEMQNLAERFEQINDIASQKADSGRK